MLTNVVDVELSRTDLPEMRRILLDSQSQCEDIIAISYLGEIGLSVALLRTDQELEH